MLPFFYYYYFDAFNIANEGFLNTFPGSTAVNAASLLYSDRKFDPSLLSFEALGQQ